MQKNRSSHATCLRQCPCGVSIDTAGPARARAPQTAEDWSQLFQRSAHRTNELGWRSPCGVSDDTAGPARAWALQGAMRKWSAHRTNELGWRSGMLVYYKTSAHRTNELGWKCNDAMQRIGNKWKWLRVQNRIRRKSWRRKLKRLWHSVIEVSISRHLVSPLLPSRRMAQRRFLAHDKDVVDPNLSRPGKPGISETVCRALPQRFTLT